MFRNATGNDVTRFRAVQKYIKSEIANGDLLMYDSAQVRVAELGSRFIFRVRRMDNDELKVDKMELSNKVPLQYDFLRNSGMLPPSP